MHVLQRPEVIDWSKNCDTAVCRACCIRVILLNPAHDGCTCLC